jgi:hypothetical protein
MPDCSAHGVTVGHNTVALLMRRAGLSGPPLRRRAKRVPAQKQLPAWSRCPDYGGKLNPAEVGDEVHGAAGGKLPDPFAQHRRGVAVDLAGHPDNGAVAGRPDRV